MWFPSKALLLGPSTGSGLTVLTPPSVRGEPFGGVYPEPNRRAQDRLVEPHLDWVLGRRHIHDGPHDGPKRSINPVRPRERWFCR